MMTNTVRQVQETRNENLRSFLFLFCSPVGSSAKVHSEVSCEVAGVSVESSADAENFDLVSVMRP